MSNTIMKNCSFGPGIPDGCIEYVVGAEKKIVCTPSVASRFARRFNLTFISPMKFFQLYIA